MGKEPTVIVATQEGDVLDFTLTAYGSCGSEPRRPPLHGGLFGSCQLRLRIHKRVQCRSCGGGGGAYSEVDPQCAECWVQARRDRAAAIV